MNCEKCENFKPKELPKGVCETCKYSRWNNADYYNCLIKRCISGSAWEPVKPKEVRDCSNCRGYMGKPCGTCKCYSKWEPIKPKEELGCHNCGNSFGKNGKSCLYSFGICGDGNPGWIPIEPKKDHDCETCRHNSKSLICDTCMTYYTCYEPERRKSDKQKS